MSREVQKGDLVIVTISDKWKNIYRVYRITPTELELIFPDDQRPNPEIIITATFKDGKWESLDADEFQFIGPTFSLLTHDRETNMRILSELTPESIEYLSRINASVKEIYEDDEFWKLMVETQCPYAPDSRRDETWFDYFEMIPLLFDCESDGAPIKRGIIMYERTELLEKVKDEITQEDADLAAEKGLESVLNWLAENNLYLPSKKSISRAARHNKVNILRWARKQNLAQLSLGDLVRAALKGATGTIEWAVEVGIYQGKGLEIANELAREGCLNMIEWLEDHNLPLPDQSGAKAALENDFPDVVEWLDKRGIHPDDIPVIEEEELKSLIMDVPPSYLENLEGHMPSYATTYAAEYNRPDIQGWLFERHGLAPSTEDADYALDGDAQESLKWMYRKFKVLPSRHGADRAAWAGQMHNLKWLESKGVLPTKAGADLAAEEYPEVVMWLESMGLAPGKAGIRQAIIHNQTDTLEFLMNHGYYKPSQEDADLAVFDTNLTFFRGRKKMIDWLAEQGFPPSQKAIDRLASQGFSNRVKWIYRRFHLAPTPELAKEWGNEVTNWMIRSGLI